MTHMYSVLSTKCCKNVSQIWLCLKLSNLNASSWVECAGFVGDIGASTHPPPPSFHLPPVALQPPKEPRQKYPQFFFRCNNISSTYPYKSVRQHFGGTFFFWHSWSHCLLVFLSISFLWDPGLWGPIFWSGCLTDTVCPSVSKWPCVDLNDVTLADEDTNPRQYVAMQMMRSKRFVTWDLTLETLITFLTIENNIYNYIVTFE